MLRSPLRIDRLNPMKIRLTPYFKRTLAVLFLFTGLSSQLQLVFACELMDGQPKPVCCCDEEMSGGCKMGGGCSMDEDIHLDPDCCEVSVDDFSDVTLGGPTSTASQVVLQNAPRPPPLALCTVISRPQPKFGGTSLPFCHATNRHFVPSEIYLVTKRLRI